MSDLLQPIDVSRRQRHRDELPNAPESSFLRLSEVDDLCGDASKAAKRLGWKRKTTFHDLVFEMLEHDLKLQGVDPAEHLRNPPAGVSPT